MVTINTIFLGLSSELSKDILFTLEPLLSVNHAIVLPYMRRILKICLKRADENPLNDEDRKKNYSWLYLIYLKNYTSALKNFK